MMYIYKKNRTAYRTGILWILMAITVFFYTGCSQKGKLESENESDEESIIPSDYSQSSNWLAYTEVSQYDADVLYFYPTTYMPESEEDSAICDINNNGMRLGAQSMLACQASAFEECADIYAPFYRQVNAMTLAGMNQKEMVEAESGEPKADVFAALDGFGVDLFGPESYHAWDYEFYYVNISENAALRLRCFLE